MSEHLEGVEIERIIINEEGSGEYYLYEGYCVGREGVTRIEGFVKSGSASYIPYIRVWKGDAPYAEFCQHNIQGVYFKVAVPS